MSACIAPSENIIHPFEPFCPENSRLLILGSFPSPASRACGFYYGHSRNRFWEVICRVSGDEIPIDVQGRMRLLLKRGISLWDTIASCDIVASSDSSIKNARVNDIPALLKTSPIEAIFCNGKKSAALFEKHIQPAISIPMKALPSTSPANASYSLESLVAHWKVIGRYLANNS